MANVASDIASFKIDSSTGVLKTISGDINSVAFEGGNELLEDTGLGDSNRTVVSGLGNARNITFSGWMNSTTEGIFAPLAAAKTSITKTLVIGLVSGQFYTGEVWPEGITLSVNAGELATVSGNLRAQTGLTRTSVSP